MSLFSQILSSFNKLSLTQKQKLSEEDINRVLDKLCIQNANNSQFDRQVAQQIWQHTTKTPQGRVLLKDYIQTIIDARQILKQNIEKCQKQLELEKDTVSKLQLEEFLLSYYQDYKIIGEPFKLEEISLNKFYRRSPMQRSMHQSVNGSNIFADSPSKSQVSSSLGLVLVLTFVMLLFQIPCLYVRNHFLNIITYITVLSIFLMNYFDKNYIKLCLCVIFLSVGFDIAWNIFCLNEYWNDEGLLLNPNYSGIFLKLVVATTILLVVGKFSSSFLDLEITVRTHERLFKSSAKRLFCPVNMEITLCQVYWEEIQVPFCIDHYQY